MWRLGFFFHEMSFGLLSVFIPLYVLAIGGSLVDIGIMIAVALFLAIPASFFWGYACDKTRRYKRYILISFLSSAIVLYVFTFTSSILLLTMLYATMSIFHIAHEPPKNVLIAELYSREQWGRTFALYEAFTEAGWLVGLALGFFVSVYGVSSTYTLFLCSGLNLIALIISLFLVADPVFIFERGLVSIEKTIDFTYRGVAIASRILDGYTTNERLKKENLSAICLGLVLFSLATSILFTPLPIFLSSQLVLPASIVFAVYILNSGAGVAGYIVAGRRSDSADGKSAINKIVMFRAVLAFAFVGAALVPTYQVASTAVILILYNFAYALFLVFMLSLTMELIPAGKSGVFNVLIGVGAAGGSFIGPFLAEEFGFTYVFIVTGVVFLLSYIVFKILS
jgi:MFS family permease